MGRGIGVRAQEAKVATKLTTDKRYVVALAEDNRRHVAEAEHRDVDVGWRRWQAVTKPIVTTATATATATTTAVPTTRLSLRTTRTNGRVAGTTLSATSGARRRLLPLLLAAGHFAKHVCHRFVVITGGVEIDR